MKFEYNGAEYQLNVKYDFHPTLDGKTRDLFFDLKRRVKDLSPVISKSVDVIHKAVLDIIMLAYRTNLSNQYKPKIKFIRQTTVYLIKNDPTTTKQSFFRASSIQSPKDQDVKKIGREVAVERLISQIQFMDDDFHKLIYKHTGVMTFDKDKE